MASKPVKSTSATSKHASKHTSAKSKATSDVHRKIDTIDTTAQVEVNAAYLRPQVAQQIKAAFLDNIQLPNIKLGQILSPQSYAWLRATVEKTQTHATVAPLEYHFSMARVQLPQLSKSLSQFITPIFGDLHLANDWKLISLTWKDYSMLLDTQTTRDGFDIIVDLSDDFPENAGADIIYTIGGQDNVEIPAASNTLVIVKIDKRTRAFMRYVNHYGKDRRRLFLVQHLENS